MKKKAPLKILFIEDASSDTVLAEHSLKAAGLDFQFQTVKTEETLRTALKQFDPDLVISDYSMPEFDGMTALHTVLELNAGLPFIVFTGSINEETAVECMKAGATDYVLKEHVNRLPLAVKSAIKKKKMLKATIEAQQKLHENEKKFRALYESATDGVIGIDSKGRITLWNPAAEKMFGFGFKEVSGKDLHKLIASKKFYKQFFSAFQKFTRTGEGRILGKPMEVPAKRKDGIEFPVEFSLSKFRWQGEWQATAIIRDISERKKREAELVEAKEKAQESDRLKSVFLANMSHEIRTPMNGIIGFVDLLRQGNLSHEEEEEYLGLILSSSKHLLTIINDILEIARIEVGQVSVKPVSFNLKKLLKETYEVFYARTAIENKNISLLWEKSANLPGNIISDPVRIKQVLYNLLSNALKFTREGSIRFGAEEKQQGLLSFYVADTGIGIEPAFQEKIFDRFQQVEGKLTREYGGTGLGLSISKGIVEKLGGKISLKSKPGKGSTFFFTIPFISKEKKKTEKIPDKKKIKTYEGHSILVAEDTDSNYIIVEKMLAPVNVNIVRAMNGKEAVMLCCEHDFSLIILDLKLPILNGYEAARKIRIFRPDLPIIAQTTYAMEDDREQALNAGCNDYLTKPVQRKKLFELLGKYIGSTHY